VYYNYRKGKNKMRKTRNKTFAITIAIFFMLSMSASMMLIPTANAHAPAWQIPTYAYVQAQPNPIGVHQVTHIYTWLDISFPGATPFNDYRFHDYKLTITAPDGTVTTQTWSVVIDSTSNQGSLFTPTQVGTYILNFTYPGQGYAQYSHDTTTYSDFVNDTYLPSSASTILTVQQTPMPSYPTAPLPTSYWTRPIFGENPDWWSISSNWLGLGGFSVFGSGNYGYGSSFQGDAIGPQTSHVMWTKQVQGGGVVGGNKFQIKGDTYFQGSAYQDRFVNPIVIDGMLYYTEPISFAGGTSGPTDCVNLQTGQLVWSRADVPALNFGYIYDVQNRDQHGVYPPILVSIDGSTSTWMAYDAYTGDFMFNVTNVPYENIITLGNGGGGVVYTPPALGDNGEYLLYVLANDGTPTNPQYYAGQWNSSNLWFIPGTRPQISSITPPITDGSDPRLYDWNISLPSLNTQTTTPIILQAFPDNMLICESGSFPVGFAAINGLTGGQLQSPYTYFAINLNASKGSVGSILWTQTITPPPGNLTISYVGADPTVGVFIEYHWETMQWVGYSMATGQKLWGPVGNQNGLSYYNNDLLFVGQNAQLAYGKLYTTGFGSFVYCYDLKNGHLLWTYGTGGEGNSTNSGLPYPGNYPTAVYAIGNGIVYLQTSTHTFETPLYKGALARAINATTGQEIWTLPSIQSESERGAIADGYATFLNGYDNSIYSVGRGPSATSVTANPAVSTLGNNVVIRGTVVDISAGTKQSQQAADFPNGVPVASDASMTDWMSYVYQQQAEPTNFIGVHVQIAVLDSNGNHYPIGTATTDASGMYSLTWAPTISGNFTVYATFGGTNGYWPSTAETTFNVMNAPATASPTPAPASNTYAYVIDIGIAIIILIIVVGAILAMLLLRKRP
jgi:hypothetical protein